jgi:hypothetical protein
MGISAASAAMDCLKLRVTPCPVHSQVEGECREPFLRMLVALVGGRTARNEEPTAGYEKIVAGMGVLVCGRCFM